MATKKKTATKKTKSPSAKKSAAPSAAKRFVALESRLEGVENWVKDYTEWWNQYAKPTALDSGGNPTPPPPPPPGGGGK